MRARASLRKALPTAAAAAAAAAVAVAAAFALRAARATCGAPPATGAALVLQAGARVRTQRVHPRLRRPTARQAVQLHHVLIQLPSPAARMAAAWRFSTSTALAREASAHAALQGGRGLCAGGGRPGRELCLGTAHGSLCMFILFFELLCNSFYSLFYDSMCP